MTEEGRGCGGDGARVWRWRVGGAGVGGGAGRFPLGGGNDEKREAGMTGKKGGRV